MCGIAGGLRHSISPEQASQILRRLLHRGPDDNGLWAREEVWLANTRLAIQDLSPAASQPMRTADKNYYIVYNGELYNTADLRQQLVREGRTFYTHCDTEVLLNAFIVWGSDCLKKLEGDFAFAVWCEAKQELFIARDPMGVKPLYIYNDGDKVLFASEIKAMLDLEGLDYSLRPEVFADYLLYLYSPSEATPFRRINKLLPGHFVQLSLKGALSKPQKYDRIEMMSGKETATSRDWPLGVENTLGNAVKRQLISDVPIGIMLSGGLDSSLIAALARKAAPELPLQAFCIHTEDAMQAEGFEDDVPFAKTVAKSLNLPLTEIRGELQPSPEWIDKLVWHLDEPQADPAAWYSAMIAAEAHEAGIKVLLSGAGADDIFSGYRRHQAVASWRRMHLLPRASKAVPEMLQRMLPGNVAVRRAAKLFSASGLSAQHAAIHSHFWAEPEYVRQLMSLNNLPPQNPYNLFESLLTEIPSEKDLLQQMLFWEQRTFLPHHNLNYLDKMGMAHSVEMRVPFVDKQVVALAAAMPASLKLHGRQTKYILRQVARHYLPEQIINRSKTGFGAPLRNWIKGPLSKIVKKRLLDSSFLGRGFFDAGAIELLIRENEQGRKDSSYTLFSLLCIESWLRQFAPVA